MPDDKPETNTSENTPETKPAETNIPITIADSKPAETPPSAEPPAPSAGPQLSSNGAPPPGISAPTPETAPAPPPGPSATVEPFQSAGGPPPAQAAPKKSKGALVIVLILAVLFAIGGVGYFLYSTGQLPIGTKASPSPSSTPKPATSDTFDTSLQGVDTAMGDLNTNLTDVDAVMADKQGDLSE